MKTASRLLALACLLGTLSPAARADYGFIPDYKKLVTRLGFSLFKSSQNFATDGVLENIVLSGQPVDFTEKRFWLDLEYGIAQDWSLYVAAGLASSSVDGAAAGGAQILTGSGLSDATLAIRWNFKSTDPIITAEAYVGIPLATTKVPNDEVVVTNGAFDVGLKLHTGHRSGILSLSLSPGFLFRSSGYSSAITGDAAVDLDFKKGYIRGFGYLIYSIEETALNDSSLSSHDAAGSGGTYARLSGSPFGLYAGGRLGFRPIEELVVEGQFVHSIFGARYPNFFELGFNIGYTFDFFAPIKAKRVKEVPFEEDQDDFYKNR